MSERPRCECCTVIIFEDGIERWSLSVFTQISERIYILFRCTFQSSFKLLVLSKWNAVLKCLVLIEKRDRDPDGVLSPMG